MEILQQLSPYLLLFHVLCPLLMGYLLGVVFSDHSRIGQRISVAVILALCVSSLMLMLAVFDDASAPDHLQEVRIEWKLPGGSLSPGLMDRVVWGVDGRTAVFLMLIPWVALTSQVFCSNQEKAGPRTSLNLILLGTVDLFLVGWDLGSLLSAAVFTVLILSIMMVRYGGESKRSSAGLFLAVQMIGIFLLAAGLAMYLASAGIIRSAPHGIPGDSHTSLMKLADLIRTSIHQHPAAEKLWEAYRGWPSLLVLGGTWLMAAGFPLQTWFSDVHASASLGERLWLVIWMKSVLLVGLRTVMMLDPHALRDVGWWGLVIAVPGSVFVAALLFAQAYLPRLQSSAIFWSQQVTLITVFAATRDLDYWLTSLLICHTAALVLLTIGLSMISERYRSVEISSFQGLSSITGWVLPVFIVCTLTLTLSPTGLGLMNAWLACVTLQGSETLAGSFLRLLYLFANLLALAGLARVTRQLGTGSLRLPVIPSVLSDRVQLPTSARTLNVSRTQKCLLCGWGLLAVASAFLFPLVFLFKITA